MLGWGSCGKLSLLLASGGIPHMVLMFTYRLAAEGVLDIMEDGREFWVR